MKIGYVIFYHFLHTDAAEISQCDHVIKYVLHHGSTQCTYCKYFKLFLQYFNSRGTHCITKVTCVLCCSGIEYETVSCFCVQLREFVAFRQLVTCDLFQLAEVSVIMMRRMK